MCCRQLLLVMLSLMLLLLFRIPATTQEAGVLQFEVQADKPIGPCDHSLWANMGYDPFYAATAAERAIPFWRRVRETGSIQRVRCHNLFTDGPPMLRPDVPFGLSIFRMTTDNTGKARLDPQWWFLDEVLDLLVAAGIRPILECDFMPDALAEERIVRNYGGGAINTPNDYELWAELIYQTIKHCEERYGADEVRKWRWEIWNEPDLATYFIDGGKISRDGTGAAEAVARLCKMYDYFVAAAERADPKIVMGGPGLAGHPIYMQQFLEHCARGKNALTGQVGTRIDFISWHGYGPTESHVRKNQMFRSMIETRFPDLAKAELQQNEWGQALRRAGVRTATSYEAAFICKAVDAIYSNPDAAVDMFLRWGQPVSGGVRGWRTLAADINGRFLPSPGLHAYELLARLGDERIAFHGGTFGDPVRGFATRTKDGSVQIVLYHLVESQPTGQTPADVRLAVTGLSPADGRVSLTHYRVDAEHGSFVQAFRERRRLVELSDEEIDALKTRAENILLTREQVEVKAGRLELNFTLPPEAISVLFLGREPEPGADVPDTPHVRRLISAENEYLTALATLKAGDLGTARDQLTAIADRYDDLHWSQRALRRLVKLELQAGNPQAAQVARDKLLATPLWDFERTRLLADKAQFAREQGDEAAAGAAETEIEKILNAWGCTTKWLVLGPISPERARELIGLLPTLRPGEPVAAAPGLEWRPANGILTPVLDLAGLSGPRGRPVACMVGTYLTSPEPRWALLVLKPRIGGRGGIVIAVNGKVRYQWQPSRRRNQNFVNVEIELAQGINTILIAGWAQNPGLHLHIMDADGRPMTDIQFSTSAE